MPTISTFKNWLSERIDGTVLGVFRLLFGLVMVFEMLYYFRIRLVDDGLIAPKMLFKYEGFEWVHPFSAPLMKGLLFVMLVCAGLLAAGVFFKWACRVFAVLMAYFFLCDKSLYNNHLYLFVLLAILISLTNADDFVSLKKGLRQKTTARWSVFILQAQVMIVYFYGGLAKLNPDWIFRQEPIRTLAAKLGVAGNELAVLFLDYGGLAIDLFAPILLWWKPARRYAIWAYLFFHVTNSIIFDDIGVFPFTMIAALLLYYETQEVGFLKTIFGNGDSKAVSGKQKAVKKTATVAESIAAEPSAMGWGLSVFLMGWFVFQLTFPLRGYFLPNPQDFTTIGNRFSWRMKIDTRVKEALTYTVENAATGQKGEVDISKMLNPMQLNHLAQDPRSAAAFARYLKAESARRGFPDSKVFATIQMSYNGRKGQLLVDPTVDLASVDYDPLQPIKWVETLKK